MIAALSLLCLLNATPAGAVSSDDLDAYIEEVNKARKACGPTSVCYCLRRLGHPAEMREIWREAPMDSEGVRGSDLLRLFHAHGVAARPLRGDPASVDALPIPAVLIIDDQHCVVYEGVDLQTNEVRYFEPAMGQIRSVPREEVQRHWSGEAIVFQPPLLSSRAFAAIAFLAAASILTVAFMLRWLWSRYRPLAAPSPIVSV